MDFKKYLEEKLKKDLDFKERYEKKDLKNLLIDIGNEIERERIKNGIKQNELARKLKTSQSYISRLENGSLSPSIKMLHKISEFFGGFVEFNISYNQKNNTNTQFDFSDRESISICDIDESGNISFKKEVSKNNKALTV